MSKLAFQIANQGDDVGLAAPIINFEAMEQSAVCIVSDSPDVKEEEEVKDNVSSIIGSTLESVKDGVYIRSEMVVGKEEEIEMGQAVVSCLETVGAGGEGASPILDSLGIVIEEVHIMEEVKWHQEEVPLQNQQEHILFNQLCRVCALETENVVSVFGEEGTELQLVEKIHWHLPIEVKEDDKLPVTVCSSCISTLNSFHELATTCFKANEKLQKLFNIDESDMNDCGENSNFAATHLQLDKPLDSCDRTVLFRESIHKAPNITGMQRSSKRPKLPSHQLSKAIELLKKAKEGHGKSMRSTQKTLNNGHKSNILSNNDAAEMDQSGDDHYADNEDVKINSIPSDDLTQNTEEPHHSGPSPICIEKSEYCRPQRKLKKKTSKDCDIFLKSKMVGVMQHIMRKEDENEDEIKERKRNVNRKEWRCETCGYVLPRKTALIMHQQRKHAPQNFSCSYCDKTFRNAIAMKVHERSHTKVAAEKTEPTSYMCEFCGKSFRGKKTLKEHHLANHSDEKPYKCDKCDRNYGSLASLDIHKATHSTETPYLCDLCGKSFKHVSNLRSHKRSHMDDSDKNRQVCDVCGKGFRSRFHLSEHMNVHTGRRPYSCNVCGKHFHKKIQLRQHGSAHSGMQPFKCHLCGVRFNRRGNMTQHIKRHDRERKYTCRVCNEGFATLGAVLSHRKKHTKEEVENSIRQQTGTVDDPEQVAYKCEVCGKLLAKKESLSIHMRSHTGEKPFECGVCGKRLSNKGSLSYHMRSFHTGERPHTCQYCGEGFLSREARLVHERIHTGEKPYICSVCGMGFRCSSNLAQHSRVHSEARPHPCPHCEKRFQRKGALDVHIRTHTGERPYACDMCGRRFTQKNDMLKHRRTHSPDRPCPCPQCGQVFSQKRELAKHQLLHIATSQTAVQHTIENSPPTQTVLITTADSLITYPEINVPVIYNY
ncbi:zinc finger protein 665-like isoform X2 [Zootermopsis nevadensis]|uniref:zinc finger protein 665-like isoform X2 n=1 Tax=Zootermopsis nevadensis TaxID=136037 RepID=UPI000B8E637D|nr:zinc finger protein 665-like isoform X2 [Zootermopsis nevadensis]